MHNNRSNVPAVVFLIIVAIVAAIVLFAASRLGAETLCNFTYLHTWMDNGNVRVATGVNGTGEAVSYLTVAGDVIDTQSNLSDACTAAHLQIRSLAAATLKGAATWRATPDATFEKGDAMQLMYGELLTIRTQSMAGKYANDDYFLNLYFREAQVNGDYLNDWLTHVNPVVQPVAQQVAIQFLGLHNTIYLPVVIGE